MYLLLYIFFVKLDAPKLQILSKELFKIKHYFYKTQNLHRQNVLDFMLENSFNIAKVNIGQTSLLLCGKD